MVFSFILVNNNEECEDFAQPNEDMNELVDNRPQTPSDQSEPDVEQNLEAEIDRQTQSKQSDELLPLTTKPNRRGGRRRGQIVDHIKSDISSR